MKNTYKKTPKVIEDDEDVKSKSQLKREMEELQKLGKKLLDIKPDVLDKMELSDRLRAAIDESKRITQNEAKRRHLQFIGKLMRDINVDEIRELIERQDAGSKAHAKHFHQLESWRDALIDNDKNLDTYLEAYPQADRQHVRQLVRNAKREIQQNKAPASARKLFKYIRQIDESNDAPESN